MKFLLTVLASMMITGSAMAACEKSTAHECKTEAECNSLNKDGGAKYSFDASSTTAKCMVAVSTVATKCVDGVDSGRAFNVDKSGSDANKDKPAAGVTK